MNNINNHTLSPGILSLLPTIYVAWADSVLSPTEIKIIQEKIDQLNFLDEEDKEYLTHWINPQNEPSKKLFQHWVKQIKIHAQEIDSNKKLSLAELGLEIAQNNIQFKNKELWDSPKTKKALFELEEALGLNNVSSQIILLRKLNIQPKEHEKQDSFSIDKMKSLLDGTFEETKDKMRRLLRDPEFKISTSTNKEEKRKSILRQLKELAKQGVSAYSFPIEYGGSELNGDHIAVFELLAFHDLSLTIKFGVQFGLFGGAVYLLGTESHHKKYIQQLHKAELLGCFAMTETGHGSNVKGLETTAHYDHDSQSLTIHSPNRSAGKEYIGNALDAHMAAVFCQLYVNGTNHGVHAILVQLRNQNGQLLSGITVEDCGYKMGLNGVDNGRIWFNNVKVPAENLLNKYGSINQNGEYESIINNPTKRFFTMLGALVVGRICVGLAGVSASKLALYIAIKYAFQRRQFGQEGGVESLIIDYPTHQRRLMPLLAKTYAYHFALSELADKYAKAKPEDIRKIETLAAGLKAKATWFTTSTIQECREACGGKGYLSENRFADLKADTDIFTTFEGDNYVLMQLVAKGKLTEYKQSFHSDGFRAVINHLYTKLSNTLCSLNPVNTRNTNVEHLNDRAFHLHAFKFRETKLLVSLSDRMRSLLSKRVDPYQAFLKCQNHMVVLAHAYVERVVLKAFVSKINRTTDQELKQALIRLCDLYALSTIEERKGWYLENNYLEGSKSKAIRRVIDKQCRVISKDAVSLVEAFDIPKELIAAEIVVKD